jgi:UDP-3-O-[3-hydroxymyristoyl] glucosamine N-acyltransferase
MSQAFTLAELAKLVRGDVAGDGAVTITGVSGIKEAADGEIVVVADPKYVEYLERTAASAVIRSSEVETTLPSIVIDNPYLAFVKVMNLYVQSADAAVEPGIHEMALVDPTAELGQNVSIGPFCTIGPGSRIGADTKILFGCFIGTGVSVGENCLIYPNVTVRERCEVGDRVILHSGAVIGADGFGYIPDGERHIKVPQIGKVILEDDVEIGANTAVDRATTEVTRICAGTKIDNLVQIAHNCVIGKNAILAGQVGVSGSTTLGENVIVAGQVGIAGHIEIGDRAIMGAQAGVTKSVPADTTVSGYPAREHGFARRIYVYTARLPELYDRVKELERRLAELDKREDEEKSKHDR